MRSPALVKHIDTLTSKDFTTVTLDRPGSYNRPKVHEDPAVKLTSYPGTVRQLVVTGLGREAPTVISPVLRHASLPGQTPIPWWGGRILRYEFA